MPFASLRTFALALAATALACTAGGSSSSPPTCPPCPLGSSCDPGTHSCVSACAAAATARLSSGCDFWAVNLETSTPDGCFAVVVANASPVFAHLEVEYASSAMDPSRFTFVPEGLGSTLSFSPYQVTTGLAPGTSAVLFLAGASGGASIACPAAVTAVPSGSQLAGTGRGRAFHLTSDVPVAAYQANPWAAASGITGSTLLLPTAVWGSSYLAATGGPPSTGSPALAVVAQADGTHVTLRPSAAIAGGVGVPASAAGTPTTITLGRGEYLQLSQNADLTGSLLAADAPVGLFGSSSCAQVPVGTSYCDHVELMLPPVNALASAYAAVPFRPRLAGDVARWRLLGVTDGTVLAYAPAAPAGAPLTLNQGQEVDFATSTAFTVQSQDPAHPFLLLLEMSGSAELATPGYGDPEPVPVTPPAQFVTDASFSVNPTFPEADLVVVRAKDGLGVFRDVTLDCAGALGGWTTVGDYQWTRVDLVTGDFSRQGACGAGWNHASSTGPFGLTVWGWTTPLAPSVSSASASYAVQAGAKMATLNSVVITP